MSIYLEQSHINSSLEKAKLFNERLTTTTDVQGLVMALIQSNKTGWLLSHEGLVLTPRIWDGETRKALGYIANTARLGLQKIAYFLATSNDDIAVLIRNNMLGGPHLELFEKALQEEAEKGISTHPFEIGRADVIN